MKRQKKGSTSRFPLSIFWVVLLTLLVTTGIHIGILVGMNEAGWSDIIQTHIMVVYWVVVSASLTAFVRRRMKAVYDTPLQKISAATKKVASGDFSVRIEPLHSKNNEDYLDVMIGDLNAMIAELGSIETLKTDFISNVSHEMKTPLSVINNYGTLLQSDSLTDAERKEYAAALTAASRRMSEMITNILRMNRLENQQLEAKKEPYDLSAALGECLLGFENVWEEKHIDLEADIPDGVTVNSDSELLGLVWNNLFSNAFKFTEPGGKVSVKLSEEERYAAVTVSDTGCGMDDETIRHIFDKFYQGDTSHATQGNGLGLALVKRVIDLVGGEIEVNSKSGEGSNFTVKIRKS